MRVAVTGGTGQLGSAVVKALAGRGHEVISISRNTPKGPLPEGVEHRRADLTTGAGLQPAIVGATAVVDAANDSRRAKEVLQEGSARLLAAEQTVGIEHHVAISIVGCEQLPRFGYYRIKAAEEARIEQAEVPWTLIRATQFHTLIASFFTATAKARVVPRANFPLQPIAPESVADRIVELIEAGPSGRVPDVAGPKVETLTELAGQWREWRKSQPGRGGPLITVPLPIPGKPGRVLQEGALTNPGAAAPGPGFGEWLHSQATR